MVFWAPGMSARATNESFRTPDVLPTILAAMGISQTSAMDGTAHLLGGVVAEGTNTFSIYIDGKKEITGEDIDGKHPPVERLGDMIVLINPAFEAITGYTQAEVLGRNCRFLQGPATDPAAGAGTG